MTPDEVDAMLWILLIATSVCVRIYTKSTAAGFATFFGLYFLARIAS